MSRTSEFKRGCAIVAAIACLVTVYGCASQSGPDSEIALAALDPMTGGVPVRVGIMDSPVVVGGETTYFVIMLDDDVETGETQEVSITYDLEGDPSSSLWSDGFTPDPDKTIGAGERFAYVKLRTKAGANGIVTIGVKSTDPSAGLTVYTSLRIRP